MCDVTGCRHPAALSAKNALLPAVLHSVVCDRRKQIGGSQGGVPHLLLALSHSLGAIPVRILLEFLNGGDSPKTMMNDLLGFKLYLHFLA